MNEYYLLVYSRAKCKEMIKQAAQVRLGKELSGRGGYPFSAARTVATVVAVITAAFPWLRRG